MMLQVLSSHPAIYSLVKGLAILLDSLAVSTFTDSCGNGGMLIIQVLGSPFAS
jgi:hypothetical protein